MGHQKKGMQVSILAVVAMLAHIFQNLTTSIIFSEKNEGLNEHDFESDIHLY
jgi:hypothetical protein